MRTAATSARGSRGVAYALVVVAIAVALGLAVRFAPGFLAASTLPFLLVLLVCPIAMFFMMRSMNSRPR